MGYLLFLSTFLVLFLYPVQQFTTQHPISFFSPGLLISLAILLYSITKIFDVPIKNVAKVREGIGYYILPVLYLLSASYFFAALSTLNEGMFGKVLVALSISLPTALIVTVLTKNKNFNLARYNFLFSASLVTYFFSSFTLANAYWADPSIITQLLLVVGSAALSWLIFYELFWLKKAHRDSLVAVSVLSMLAAEVAWAGSYWMIHYNFVFRGSDTEPLLGIPVTSLLLLISVGYFAWGLIFHRLTTTLTRKIFYEYLTATILIIGIILITTRYQIG